MVKNLLSEPDRELVRVRLEAILSTSQRNFDIAAGAVQSRVIEKVAMDSLTASVVPCTIYAARYGGTIEGGRWIALHHPTIPQECIGEVYECKSWFDDPSCLVGKGNTPNEALLSLHNQL